MARGIVHVFYKFTFFQFISLLTNLLKCPDVDIKSYLGCEAKLKYMKTGSNKALSIVF